MVFKQKVVVSSARRWAVCGASGLAALLGSAQAWASGPAVVSTDTETLLSLAGDQHGEDVNFEAIKQFVTCFVSTMDLPQQVYIDCGMSVVTTAQACKGQIMNVDCIGSAIDTAQKCALPVKDAVDGARQCMDEQKK